MLKPYIPYLGNKYLILDNIWQTLSCLNMPEIKGVADLFCGGGSMAYYAAGKGYNVVANDIEKGLIDLHRLIQTSPATVKDFFKVQVDRDSFKEIIKDDTPFGAFVRSVWSFSNQGKHFLWGKDKEEQKFDELSNGVKKHEIVQRIKHIKDIIYLYEKNPRLNILFENKSYQEVDIPDGFLIYCDPPYKGTMQYKSGGFDHDAFYKWALDNKNLVFISEYSMPDGFHLIAEFEKSNEGGGRKNAKKITERLYCNKPLQKLELF